MYKRQRIGHAINPPRPSKLKRFLSVAVVLAVSFAVTAATLIYSDLSNRTSTITVAKVLNRNPPDSYSGKPINLLVIGSDTRDCLLYTSQDYRGYCQLMRAEMETMEPLRYARLRRSFVSKLLARESIFHSPLGSGNEHAARQNLEGEYAKLSALIPGTPAGKDKPVRCV